MSTGNDGINAYNGVELTDELLDGLACEYEDGTWSGHKGSVRAGRPRFGEEKLVPLTVKVAPSTRSQLDAAARATHQSRSSFVRDALDRAVRNALDKAAML